ncbi:GntR family transcriptional regulator [Yoonia sp. R2-816]|uniref:GntR family transcriptional regulator n=1 Tax=Yoonia sp. R2-816 TaxID=3342638 RepID=UPI00372A4E73
MNDHAEKPAAADVAYETIRGQILGGVLQQGQRLTEEGLASELGLSRTPVRDAIQRLTHEGFVERGKGYNTRVALFPEEELEQIFEIRRRLESYAAGRAAKLATLEQIERLQDLSDRMMQHTPPQTPDDYRIISSANEDFHRTIYEAACSPRLIAVISVAVDVGVVARTYHLYDEADLLRSARHHKEITDAIAARSPEWASDVMSSHVLAAAAAATRIKRTTDALTVNMV